MSAWQRTLNISAVHTKLTDGEISPKDAAASILAAIKKLDRFVGSAAWVNAETDRLIEMIEDTSDDIEFGVEDFDNIMYEVYEWGDMSLDNKFGGRKVCWVETHK